MTSNLGQLFLQGGWVMWPLLIFSVLTWAVVIERAFVFLTLRPKLNSLGHDLLKTLQSGDVTAAKQICHTQKPFLADVFLGTMDTKKNRESVERATERNRVRMMAHLKKNLWIIGTIGSASPFIGLLGTVVGILGAFHDMSQKGAGGFAVVAGGISEALIATAAGLVVAIIALITYNVFVSMANQTTSQLKLALEELIDCSFEKAS